MAKAIDTLSIKLEFKDAGTQQIISKLSSSLKGMTNVVAGNTSPAISKLRKEILDVGKASTQSISNFKSQRNALAALRDEARVGSATFKRLTEDIKKLDAQMGKSAKSTRGRGGARQATQIAGAVVSGGIFGGPEGALGAAGGAALGGVEGAFAGAAIGAQLGGIRQALAASADYAASIEKLKIALKGVAGSQENYTSALSTAASVTAQLNVPQQDAIAGVTRLTAAVRGAGGPITDAEKTFTNVTAAIKATGGSTEDVRGAITAMVQVFSKGKVSAEELSGQLGERLPGAVTKFAEANDMTLPELQKNLKAGTVGLNELMKFIESLGDTYIGTASEIANSNAEAGARLTVAFDEMKASVGAALIDTGAQFQETFASFIKDITPGMVSAAKAIAVAFSGLAKNLKPVLAGLATFVAIFAGGKIVLFIKGVVAATGLLGVTAKATAGKIALLTAAMLSNPLFLGAAAAAGIVAGIVAITNALGAQRRELEKLAKAGEAPGADLKSRQAAISALTSQIATQRRIIQENPAGTTGQGSTARNKRRLAAEEALASLIRRRNRLTAARKEGSEPFDYGSPTGGDGTGASASAGAGLAAQLKAAQALERSQKARLNLAEAQGKISQLLAKQLNDRNTLQARITQITEKGTNDEIERATASAKVAQEKAQEKELQKAIEELYNQAKKPIEDIVKRVQDKVRFDKQYKDLLAKGVNPEIAKQIINITKAKEAALRQLDAELLILDAKKGQTGLDEKELQIIEDQIDAIKRKKEAIEGDAAKATGDVTATQEETNFMKGLTEAIEEQEDALKDLIDPLNQVKKFSDAMGESFKTSFRGLIDGSMTGKQALASFFRSMSDYFLDMAAEIAAAAIKLAALKFVQFIIGAMFGGGGGGETIGSGTGPPVPGATAPDGQPYYGPAFAKGGVFAKNGIVPYAKGGIVNKPTLFQYASGGTGQFGLMGEAGPEAILPLRRGPNGKLGVESPRGVGDIVVNVDASGSNVEGDAQQQKALGAAIGAAVQAEIIKQKRPGGLLF